MEYLKKTRKVSYELLIDQTDNFQAHSRQCLEGIIIEDSSLTLLGINRKITTSKTYCSPASDC